MNCDMKVGRKVMPPVLPFECGPR